MQTASGEGVRSQEKNSTPKLKTSVLAEEYETVFARECSAQCKRKKGDNIAQTKEGER